MNYKTPGVYVEEISIFPPSVAEVPTAIPAFIGYTEKAMYKGKKLSNKAIEISSLIEFEERFGKGSPIQIKEVTLNEDNTVSKVETESAYLMYDSIRLYFTNGGGRCYIVSVGEYGKTPKDDITKEEIAGGLSVIAKEDEPTMLLFPDAVLLTGTKLYDLQQIALKQAADLGDRFAILDLIENESITAKESYKAFRNAIGINNLLYGAAYTPWLKAGLPREVKYRYAKDSLKKYGGSVTLASLTEEDEVKATILSLEHLIGDNDTLQARINTLKGTASTLKEAYQAKLNEFKDEINAPGASDSDVRLAFKALCTLCYQIMDQIFDNLVTGDNPELKGGGPASLHYFLADNLTGEFSSIATELNSYMKVAGTGLVAMYNDFAWSAKDWTTIIDATVTPAKTYTWTASAWTNLFISASIPAPAKDIFEGATVKKQLSSAEPYISTLFKRLDGAVGDLSMAASRLEKGKEDLLLTQMPTYKNIVTAINEDLSVVPPGGAIAGVYCTVDKNRGVWKAPANVSLSGVAGLTERIDNIDQEDLNIDVNAGKSINAIRTFAGRGILVWGARTLAGNDNEWRYVPVRRFFNMVEESVKKSTYWAVFEPNDANLWVKLKAMIDNYLTLKWREGALAGSKPEEAFFVNVGLGTTMTQLDILEGRLIVDIGMAVVRPAEFIVLRFMHKMQES
ncbi:MAG: phage tail protein [Desulfobacteraceae bacterium]|nr:phage tail protein [Desulfobacteraceae bacterium]